MCNFLRVSLDLKINWPGHRNRYRTKDADLLLIVFSLQLVAHLLVVLFLALSYIVIMSVLPEMSGKCSPAAGPFALPTLFIVSSNQLIDDRAWGKARGVYKYGIVVPEMQYYITMKKRPEGWLACARG